MADKQSERWERKVEASEEESGDEKKTEKAGKRKRGRPRKNEKEELKEASSLKSFLEKGKISKQGEAIVKGKELQRTPVKRRERTDDKEGKVLDGGGEDKEGESGKDEAADDDDEAAAEETQTDEGGSDEEGKRRKKKEEISVSARVDEWMKWRDERVRDLEIKRDKEEKEKEDLKREIGECKERHRTSVKELDKLRGEIYSVMQQAK